MEGFRQVDEWPLVRKKIPSMALTFERLRVPEPERRQAAGAGAGEAAAGGPGGEEAEGGDRADLALGRNERRVFELAVEGRTVERIADLSRLGGFETCRALQNLVNLGYLGPSAATRGSSGAALAHAWDWRTRARRTATRVVATLAIAAALAGLAIWVDERGLAWGEGRGGLALQDNAVRRFLARYQRSRLEGALEVYRLERGGCPERLGELVETGLASPRDLRYPWSQEYYYRRGPEGRCVLLPPVE